MIPNLGAKIQKTIGLYKLIGKLYVILQANKENSYDII